MALSDHLTRVAKLRATIVTVDPSQRLIEAVTAEGGPPRRLAIFDIPNGFMWPVEGEDWSIYEENGYWRLGNKYLNDDEDALLLPLYLRQRPLATAIGCISRRWRWQPQGCRRGICAIGR
jgi:hypothetical protein